MAVPEDLEVQVTTADLGYPILLGILTFWALLALGAFLTTFLKKKNLREFKDYLKRLTDPRPHRRKWSGGGRRTLEGGGV
jgi:hypothetical protein